MLINSLLSKAQSQVATLPVPLELVLPGGRRIGHDKPALTLSFNDWSGVASLAAGRIGAIGEGFVEGWIRMDGSVRDLMAAAAALLPGNPAQSDTAWWTSVLRRAKSLVAHTPGRDAAQIQFHYDVSDDFFALWLDPHRVYSCAYFAAADMTLAQAQEAKLEHICRKLMLKPGERLLDIGAGWGGLLLWAAEHHGVDATGITLSKNQHAHVSELIRQKGLQGRVRMQLLDYRDLDEGQPFDKIASVGMFEHVGRANMGVYFSKMARLLRPGGVMLNHGITAGGVYNEQLGAGMGDFIEKYIFPGGELLHASLVLKSMAEAGLEMVDTENMRPHYAKTLWAWSDALESQLEAARSTLLASAGPERGEKILRAYRLYLAGSAMCFEQGWISLHQMLAVRPDGNMASGPIKGAQSGYPFNRSYMYR